MAKKKKGHGGLKFLAFIVVMVLLIVGITKSTKTEVGQRVLGNREHLRLENTRLTPRFGYTSATARLTIGSIYNINGALMDMTQTTELSIDRQSQRAMNEITMTPTAREVAPGVSAVPDGTFRDSRTEILTKDYQYVSASEETEPWTRIVNQPYYYGDALDEHYIPMIDDLMGFELRQIPTKPLTIEPLAGLQRVSYSRPAVNDAIATSALTKIYSYEFDMDTYRRVLPILAGRTHLDAPHETIVNVALGFDEFGLLRYAEVSIPSATSTTLAQALGNFHSADYHYTLEVTDISGEPITIDVPTNFVDEPVEPEPGDTIPADTVPVPVP
jgi:hypothetical protein